MSSATTTSIENASATPEVNPWLIGIVVSLAAFMEAHELDSSHVPMLSQPERVIDVIRAAAKAASGATVAA